MRWLRALWVLPGLFALYAFLATVLAVTPGRVVQVDGTGSVEIRLVRSPIHYDFLLPLNDTTRTAFGFVTEDGVPLDHPAATWLLVGWGARDFYTVTGDYGDVSLRATVKGALGDASVLRFDAWGPLPDSFETRSLTMSEGQFEALIAAIRADLLRPDAPIPVPTAGLSETDAFYQAVDRFHLFRTCNTWISRKLRMAGIRMGVWTPLPWSIRLSYSLWQAPG
ncbi:DUF2459 domain-containing protein [Maritimibacter sp. DP1N21-5]|uniref:DUF2459 domain-containing protein n=1 Tax=Maritimibacter sp. DP1N21-5 TaxID=2836867 RepID=UPI001C48FD09|nr:DUF2459 domain-containing protein [Maritimibacter sp. DP1N21-5]MBV7408067.1 DUF2459 domain-containing protein [Maritimibacter sp. DP1N21-5]